MYENQCCQNYSKNMQTFLAIVGGGHKSCPTKITKLGGRNQLAGGREMSRFLGCHEPRKNTPTFYCTGWLIGILIMVYYNALYNWVVCHPLYNPTNQGFFSIAHMISMPKTVIYCQIMFNTWIPNATLTSTSKQKQMDVSKNMGTSKWMVYNGNPY